MYFKLVDTAVNEKRNENQANLMFSKTRRTLHPTTPPSLTRHLPREKKTKIKQKKKIVKN